MSERKFILIIEDNAEESSFLERILGSKFNVQTTSNGNDAFALIRNGHSFDLIVMDVRVPGMSGDRILKGLRQLGDTTEVLILTAYDATEIAISTLHDGAFEYLTKPITKDKLITKVNLALEAAELKASENIEAQYQHRRKHFKRNFSNAISQSLDDEYDDRSGRNDSYIERLSRRRIR